MAEANKFQSLRFSGLGITIAAFAFQAAPPLLEFLNGNADPAFTLSVATFVVLPAIVTMIALQGYFFSRALSNLALFKAKDVPSPGHGWVASVPILNLLVLPWLTYTVHDRTQALASPARHSSSWSGWLMLLWWAAFIGGFAISSFAERAGDLREREAYMIATTVIGLIGSWLTKKIVGEITNGQERLAAAKGVTAT